MVVKATFNNISMAVSFFGEETGVTREIHQPICTYNKTYKPFITDSHLCLNVSYAFFCPIDTTQMSMISDNLWN